MNGVVGFLSGAATMGYAVVGIFLLRFWRRARDPLFLWFAVAFALLAVNQALTGILGSALETLAAIYSIRLLAFIIIIVAIIRKNTERQ